MARRMMLETTRDDDFTNPSLGWRNQDTNGMAGESDFSWNELAAQQRQNEENAQMAANQKLFDGYIAIETGAKQKQIALNHQRAIAGAAMMESAFKNGGMSDRSLSPAFSQAFGMPVYGGQILNLGNKGGLQFVMYGAKTDPQTGKATIAPVAMMDGVQMKQILRRAGTGDRTADLENMVDNDLSSRFTAAQLGQMGIQRRSAPISTGGTEISAAGVRALRGLPRPRSSVSSYYSDGAGGEVRTYSGPETGYQNVREASGTFSPDYQGRWKVTSVGADPNDRRYDASGNEVYNASPRQIRRYENSRTGEVVNVPDGSTLRDVLRGTSEKEKVAQINAQGRVDVAQTNAKSREEVAKFNAEAKKQIAEITARHKEAQSVNGKITGSDLAALYKVANDPLADDTVKSSALEMAEFLTDKLMNAGKAGVKGDDNTKSETIEDAWPGYSAERVAELKRRGYVWDETSGKPVKKSK